MRYYLINKTGKCYESKTEIPTPPYKKEDLVYEHYLQDMETWDSNLTMIDIYEDQLEVVKNKSLFNQEFGTPSITQKVIKKDYD